MRMSETPTQHFERPLLSDAFDDAGRAWLDEIVSAFNAGDYTEAVQALLVDEASAPGATDD